MKHLTRISIFGVLLISTPTFSALIENQTHTPAADTKLDHRFGAGMMIAGAAGVLGMSFDVNFNPFFSASTFLGTGHEFTSIGFKGQYYILGTSVHPYLGMGYANWFAGPGIVNINKINPKLIYLYLLDEQQRQEAFVKGFSVHLVYPVFGVQYVHQTQFSIAAEVMYLFDITDFNGTPYFGINTHYYF